MPRGLRARAQIPIEPHQHALRGRFTPHVSVPNGTDPIYTRLYRAIREQLVLGNWPGGTRLPSTRLLAQDLGISRGTATIAIEQLISEGWLTSETRSGVYVAQRFPREAGTACSAVGPGTPPPETGVSALAEHPIDLFPIGRWRQLHAKVWAAADKGDLLLADETPGVHRLRQLVARYVLASRGLAAGAEQVVVCTSIGSAIEIAVRSVAPPGSLIVLENPGDPVLAARLRLGGFEVAAADIDGDGLRTDRLPVDGSAAAIVVSAALHWPTGAALSAGRRDALARWARHQNARIIERDCDGHLARRRGKPVPPLAATHPEAAVLYARGLDRVAFPGLNIACLAVPENVAAAAASARQSVDGRLPISDQLVLSEFIETGSMAGWMRLSGSAILARRKALIDILASSVGALFTDLSSAGSIILLEQTAAYTGALADLFEQHGLPARPLSGFGIADRLAPDSLVLACAGVPVANTRDIEPVLREGLLRLA